MITEKDVREIEVKVKEKIKAIEDMGQHTISLDDYYRSVMHIVHTVKKSNQSLKIELARLMLEAQEKIDYFTETSANDNCTFNKLDLWHDRYETFSALMEFLNKEDVNQEETI